ncbi:hypothetical protein [Hyalangium minutum]|uniref:hypothetical protein n=1 Tax=Hyalangium minutum TaxID=394096 RepID=UPI0004E766C7|nr:hypothetical protein [Hyalangium minutum]
MTRRGLLVLLWVGLLPAVAAGGKAPKPEPVKRFISEAALKNLECVTQWEQICADDPARNHLLELTRGTLRYRTWPDGNVAYDILGRSGKLLQLAAPGSRQEVATLKQEKDEALYKGPNNVPVKCKLPNCAMVPECLPPEPAVTVRFVSEARLTQRIKELMPLVPERQCPKQKPEYLAPKAGERCLNTRKPYIPPARLVRKQAPVRIDAQPLRLFLSNDERTLLDNEAEPLLEAVRLFYTSRLARNSRTRGALTVRLHFPPGDKRPEVYVQKDEPRDADLTACLSAALRSKELFPWRPSQVADLELSFLFSR